MANGLTICLRKSIFPTQWKVAKLALIPKGGSLDMDCPKVRPICLLNEAGKIFERVISERMIDWMENNPRAQVIQGGF